MPEKILVTGGAGYIGSHAVFELKARGYHVIVLDNLSTGHEWALRSDQFIRGDIRDEVLLRAIFQDHDFDTVMHFAAKSIVSESMKNPLDYYDNNVVGAQRLIQAAVEGGVSRFIFSSTAAVYGETQKGLISEGSDKNPINPYGQSKRMIELILSDAFTAHKLSSVSFRYFNAAGARPEAGLGEKHDPETHLIPNILLSTMSDKGPGLKVFGDNYPTKDGTCVRDYIHVKDLAHAHADAVQYLEREKGAHVFNLGTGEGSSVFDILRACKAVLGQSIDYEIAGRRAGDPPVLVADVSKALELLGWSARENLNAMVSDAHQFLTTQR